MTQLYSASWPVWLLWASHLSNNCGRNSRLLTVQSTDHKALQAWQRRSQRQIQGRAQRQIQRQGQRQLEVSGVGITVQPLSHQLWEKLKTTSLPRSQSTTVTNIILRGKNNLSKSPFFFCSTFKKAFAKRDMLKGKDQSLYNPIHKTCEGSSDSFTLLGIARPSLWHTCYTESWHNLGLHISKMAWGYRPIWEAHYGWCPLPSPFQWFGRYQPSNPFQYFGINHPFCFDRLWGHLHYFMVWDFTLVVYFRSSVLHFCTPCTYTVIVVHSG